MMSTADLKDMTRAAYWHVRCFVLRLRSQLRGTGTAGLRDVDPESSQYLFNTVLLGVCDGAREKLPARVIVTPDNVAAFCCDRRFPTGPRVAPAESIERTCCPGRNPHTPGKLRNDR